MTLNTTQLKNIIDKRTSKHLKAFKEAKKATSSFKLDEVKFNCIKDAEQDFRVKNDIFKMEDMFHESVCIEEISCYQSDMLSYVKFNIQHNLV